VPGQEKFADSQRIIPLIIGIADTGFLIAEEPRLCHRGHSRIDFHDSFN